MRALMIVRRAGLAALVLGTLVAMGGSAIAQQDAKVYAACMVKWKDNVRCTCAAKGVANGSPMLKSLLETSIAGGKGAAKARYDAMPMGQKREAINALMEVDTLLKKCGFK